MTSNLLANIGVARTDRYAQHESVKHVFLCMYEQEVKVIWQKAPHWGPIPQLGVTPGGRKLYHWIPGVRFPISVP